MDTNKKISFGFTKLVKKPTVVRTQPSEEKKIELVDCLEGQSIKIKDAVEIVKEPLVIPIKDDKKNLLDRVKEAKIKRELKSEKEEDNRPDSELTLEEQAARALINDAKNRLENNIVSNSKVTVLPINEDKITIDGEKEPTLEDYENIPISDYGMAMLRGMGWKDGMGIGKDPTKTAVTSTPELRPKGLGLGASKIVKPEEPVCDKEGNALILKRGAYGKIIAGSHKGNYCEVQGLDDEAGRVIVRTSLKGEILTLNEFLVAPVTKQEYSQGAKVLNNAKYEEYKEISDRKLEAHRKTKTRNNENDSDNDSDKELNSKNKNRNQKNSSSFKKEDRSDASDHENNLSSENERRSKGRGYHKNRSDSDDETGKYKRESHRSKHRDKQTPSSDSDDKYKKSRNRYRGSSDSDNGKRTTKSKDRKKKTDHRERSRSYKDKRKSDNKKSERSRDRSSSYDYKEQETSKKYKSKSRHNRRSSSSSPPDKDYRKNRK